MALRKDGIDDTEERLLNTGTPDVSRLDAEAGAATGLPLCPGTLRPTRRMMLSRLASTTLPLISDVLGGTYEGRAYRVIDGGVGIVLILLSTPLFVCPAGARLLLAPAGANTPRRSTSRRFCMIRSAASFFGVLPNFGSLA